MDMGACVCRCSANLAHGDVDVDGCDSDNNGDGNGGIAIALQLHINQAGTEQGSQRGGGGDRQHKATRNPQDPATNIPISTTGYAHLEHKARALAAPQMAASQTETHRASKAVMSGPMPVEKHQRQNGA